MHRIVPQANRKLVVTQGFTDADWVTTLFLLLRLLEVSFRLAAWYWYSDDWVREPCWVTRRLPPATLSIRVSDSSPSRGLAGSVRLTRVSVFSTTRISTPCGTSSPCSLSTAEGLANRRFLKASSCQALATIWSHGSICCSAIMIFSIGKRHRTELSANAAAAACTCSNRCASVQSSVPAQEYKLITPNVCADSEELLEPWLH